MHTSRDALDWSGTYQGTTPCADCEGIETSVTLFDDGAFKRRMRYLGEDAPPFVQEGRFEWDESGSVVTLTTENGQTQMYKVGENVLYHLDQGGEVITGDLAEAYMLAKNRADPRIEDRKWVLIELVGRQIEEEEGRRQAFFVLDSVEGRVSGNNSCNNFFGTYVLREGNRIAFGDAMGSTSMACPDGSIEQELMGVFRETDNYAIKDGILSLHRAKMAPLARFEPAEKMGPK